MRAVPERNSSPVALDIAFECGKRSAGNLAYGGGDFIVFDRHDDGTVSFAIGDVSAKGAVGGEQADRLSRTAQTAMIISRRAATIVEALSASFYREILPTGDEYSACVAAGTIDSKHGILRYAAAGTEAAIVLRGERRHQHLGATGPLLGATTRPVYREVLMPFASGDVLLLFTDGVVESRGRDGRLLGTAGLMQLVRRSVIRDEPPSCSELLDQIDHFCSGAYRDDATLGIVRACAAA